MSWIDDKKWTDDLLPIVKQILGEHLISVGSWEQDAKEATDLIVLDLSPLRVACRIRRHEYLARYHGEFTVRAGRPNGVETELAKIMAGWGTHFFYAFADPGEFSLAKWTLIDLTRFRMVIWRDKQLLGQRFRRINGDKSSWFYAWPLALFDVAVVKSHTDKVAA